MPDEAPLVDTFEQMLRKQLSDANAALDIAETSYQKAVTMRAVCQRKVNAHQAALNSYLGAMDPGLPERKCPDCGLTRTLPCSQRAGLCALSTPAEDDHRV